MAATVYRLIYNVRGSAGGTPNMVVYFGPDLDMTAVSSPINSATVHKVWRVSEATGAWESYVPGLGGDFTSLDRGQASHGRGYLIIAKSDFVLNHAFRG